MLIQFIKMGTSRKVKFEVKKTILVHEVIVDVFPVMVLNSYIIFSYLTVRAQLLSST